MRRISISKGSIRWRWLASRIWHDQDDWVLFYRDAYPQSDIELIDRRVRKGYVEIKGDLMRLTSVGRHELGLPKEAGGQSIAYDRRKAGA